MSKESLEVKMILKEDHAVREVKVSGDGLTPVDLMQVFMDGVRGMAQKLIDDMCASEPSKRTRATVLTVKAVSDLNDDLVQVLLKNNVTEKEDEEDYEDE